ncbi:MAG TPA: prepilin peptidase, partial [Candidatus Baltobacteraceae bacterium]|nr:prepilin peptidase [Candidatus Baltobacteraceae bacterium]
MLLVAFGAVITGAACDAACGYVFDSITLPCLALLLLISIVSQTLAAFSIGVLACGGALMILYTVTRGRGLGLGDVKLACCIGAAAGAVGGVEALGIAFVFGGAYGAFLLGTGRAQRGAELRFAPYLAAGTALIALHGAFV